ncbi:glycosyltransferase family 4 protein [Sphingomonas faeni]|uniref:glycosyltransferase family 4 protein n=1 Tax=Sphingomonas faeni TaxID=185950 RepID=UPI00335271DE
MKRLVVVCNEDALDVTKLSGTPYHMVGALKQRFADLIVEREPWPRWARTIRNGVLKLTGGACTPIYWTWLNRALARRLRVRHPNAAFIVPLASNLAAALARTNPVINITDAVRKDLEGPYYVPFARMNARHARLADNIERESLERARHNSFSSPWAARGAMLHYGADEMRLSVIPWGCNLNYISLRPAWRRERTCRLLFIGMEWERKGGDLVLAAARVLEARGFDFTLDIVGAKPPREVDLGTRIAALGVLRKNDPEDHAKLDTLLDRASLLFLPTRADCTPMVFAEANAYGVPAVTCDVGGVTGVIEHGANGIVLPADATEEAMADAIVAIWSDSERYERMRVSARLHYEQRLNWAAWAEAISPAVNALGTT